MASVKFLEEVLSKDVDENAFSAIVVSLESELVTNTSVVSTGNRSHPLTGHNSNAIAATTAAPQKQQQQHLVNGARAASSMNKCIIAAAPAAATSTTNNNISLMPGISQADFVGQQQQQQPQHQHQQHVVNPTLAHNYAAQQPMKQQDPVKVVYSNSANHRNYVPVNSLPNGIINSSSTGTGTAVVIKSNPQQQQNSPPVSTMTLTGQASSNQSPVTSNVISVSKQVGQGVVSGNSPQTLLPANVQILNVNALRPQNSQGGVNKNMSRVMIPQVVGARPGAPGLTLQTLQQAQGGHILLKTENGQYQLLRVGPAPGQGTAITQNNANFRVQPVPAVATSNVSIAGTPTTTPTQTIAQPQQAQQKVQQDNTKEKCRKFLANLLELSSKEPKPVERSVRTLIQELVDAKVEPEQFCDRLEKLLNASPQPCLIGFLKKSLPLLRQSLMLKEMVIEGIRPPQLSALTQPTVVLANQQQATNTQVMGSIINTASNQQTVRIMTSQPALTPARAINSHQQQHRIVSQQVRVQTPTGLTAVNKMGSIRIQPPVVSSQTGTLPPPLTSTSSPRPMGGGRQMLVKAVPIKAPAVSHIKINTTLASTTVQTNSITMSQPRIPPSPNIIGQPAMINKVPTPVSVVQSAVAASSKPPSKEKEKKSFSSSAAYVGDDDINDVAAMGGVNLAEETQRILGSTEFVGTQIRSCKDEILLPQNPLVAKIKQIVNREGLEDAAADVPALVSHAVAERLKDLLEKFAVVAEHRLDFNKADKRYEITRNIRGQIKCLEEIDKVERKKQDEMERELLLRAAKSRSKNEDPEQAKLKAKAKEMQRVEMEELRQREANLTALNAIGPRKKPKIEPGLSPSLQNPNSSISTSLTNRQTIPRQRIKRVTMRDTLFVLEQEKDIRRNANFMFKPFLK